MCQYKVADYSPSQDSDFKKFMTLFDLKNVRVAHLAHEVKMKAIEILKTKFM